MVLASTGNSLSLRSKIEQLSLSLQCCCIASMPAQARMIHVHVFIFGFAQKSKFLRYLLAT